MIDYDLIEPLTDAEDKRLRREVERLARAVPEPPRRRSPGSGVRVPVGTIVVRPRRPGRGGPYAFVKVAEGGPQSRTWRPLAVVRWEAAHGPVPPGKVVAHADGDAGNDDLANLILATRDDVLFLSSERGFNRNPEQQRAATAAANAARARVRRLREIVPGWYMADPARRTIRNIGAPTRWDACVAVGIPVARAANGIGWLRAALGWPDVSTLGAAMLAVLVDPRRLPRAEAIRQAEALLVEREHAAPAQPRTWDSVLYTLRRRGLVVTSLHGERLVKITDVALAARGPTCDLLPIRSARVEALKAQGWVMVTEHGREYQRERADWAKLVAAAMAKGR